MKGEQPVYQLHLFTLRLWQEKLDQQLFEWRGELKNTSTGEIHYFRNDLSLYNAILAMLDTDAQAPHSDDNARPPDQTETE